MERKTTANSLQHTSRDPMVTITRPGLEFLRAQFVASWEAKGLARSQGAARDYLLAAAVREDADTSDHQGVARFALQTSPRLARLAWLN